MDEIGYFSWANVAFTLRCHLEGGVQIITIYAVVSILVPFSTILAVRAGRHNPRNGGICFAAGGTEDGNVGDSRITKRPWLCDWHNCFRVVWQTAATVDGRDSRTVRFPLVGDRAASLAMCCM